MSGVREHTLPACRFDQLSSAPALVVHRRNEVGFLPARARAGVGARTVYRYFPTQSDLYEELWLRVRKQAGTIFPSSEAEILPQIPILFGGFERNEKVIRAVLESPAGHRVRERGAPEGRRAFSKSLAELTAGMSPAKKRQVIAVFLAIYSAPFWELVRKRGELSGADAIAAAEWAMKALIESLRNKKTTNNNGRRKS